MPDIQSQIDSIVTKYQPQIDALEAEGHQMQRDFDEPSVVGGTIGVDFKVEWTQMDLSFDLPSVTMKRRDISFDIPQVTMNTKKIIFDTPSIRMETRVVGYYPEFRGFPPKITMSEIKIDVPVPFMERQEISFDIPEIKMERTDISLDLPEFRMEPFKFSMDIPEFTVVNVNFSIEAMKAEGVALKQKADNLAAAMKAEIQNILSGGGLEGSQAINDKRLAVSAPFDDAISKLTTSIDNLVALKVDPIKVPAEGGNINLRQALTDVMDFKSRALSDFDAVANLKV